MKKHAILLGLIITLLLFPVIRVSAQTVILEEHFDSLDNWEDQSTTGQYSIVAGVLVSEYWDNGSGAGPIVYRGPDGTGLNLPDSFTITYKARMTDSGILSSDSDAIVTLFHFLERAYRAQLGWLQNAINGMNLQVWIDGTKTSQNVKPLSFDETVWHTIEVEKNDLILTARINGIQVYSETIQAFDHFRGLGGTVGFTMGSGRYEIDDLVVTTTETWPPPPPLDERVEELEYEVQTLSEQYESLQEQVTNLRRALNALSDHSHDYLTGKGRGHNNSLATTGPPTQGAPEPVPAGK